MSVTLSGLPPGQGLRAAHHLPWALSPNSQCTRTHTHSTECKSPLGNNVHLRIRGPFETLVRSLALQTRKQRPAHRHGSMDTGEGRGLLNPPPTASLICFTRQVHQGQGRR